jgi:hypothetical protein
MVQKSRAPAPTWDIDDYHHADSIGHWSNPRECFAGWYAIHHFILRVGDAVTPDIGPWVFRREDCPIVIRILSSWFMLGAKEPAKANPRREECRAGGPALAIVPDDEGAGPPGTRRSHSHTGSYRCDTPAGLNPSFRCRNKSVCADKGQH